MRIEKDLICFSIIIWILFIINILFFSRNILVHLYVALSTQGLLIVLDKLTKGWKKKDEI